MFCCSRLAVCIPSTVGMASKQMYGPLGGKPPTFWSHTIRGHWQAVLQSQGCIECQMIDVFCFFFWGGDSFGIVHGLVVFIIIINAVLLIAVPLPTMSHTTESPHSVGCQCCMRILSETKGQLRVLPSGVPDKPVINADTRIEESLDYPGFVSSS